MTTEYRVVFAGAVLDGHDAEAVKQTAGQRLKVTPEQLTRLFSGKPVVLKKGLGIAAAEQYVAELNRIGMKARVEAIPAAAGNSTSQKVEPFAPPPAPATSGGFPPLSLVPEEPPANIPPQAATLANLASAPTYVVPKNQIEATRQRLEEALAAHDDPALAPTVIVSPAQAAEARRAAQGAATAPTLVIPRSGSASGAGSIAVTPEGTGHLNSKASSKGKEAERTLIADEDALNAYMAGSADPIGLLDAAGPALQPILPPIPSPPQPPRPETTAENLPPIERPEAAVLPPPLQPPAPMQPSSPPALPDQAMAAIPPAIPPAPATTAPLPPPVPAPITVARRQLPKTLPQEAALLAGKQEREIPQPAPGLALPIKILLVVTAVAGVVGLGLLIWILVSN